MTTPLESDIPGRLRLFAATFRPESDSQTFLTRIADAVEIELAHGRQLDAALRRILDARPNSMEFWEAHRAARGLVGPTTKEQE